MYSYIGTKTFIALDELFPLHMHKHYYLFLRLYKMSYLEAIA